MKTLRQVRIELRGNTYMVLYCDRKPGGRHAAAMFYAPDHSIEQVEKWVKNNPKLNLQ